MLIFGTIIIVIILWGNGIVGENELINQMNILNSDLCEANNQLINQIDILNSRLSEKDILISQYQQEVLNWTIKYKNLEETYDLTKHSLDMANQILNQLDIDQMNDLDDYE